MSICTERFANRWADMVPLYIETSYGPWEGFFFTPLKDFKTNKDDNIHKQWNKKIMDVNMDKNLKIKNKFFGG